MIQATFIEKVGPQKSVEADREYRLVCSACDAPLANLIGVGEKLPVPLLVRAECPHCGDKSSIESVSTQFRMIGAEPYTQVIDCTYSKNRKGEPVTVLRTVVQNTWSLGG